MVNNVKGIGKTLPPYALRLWIMRAMGWDYWTYRAQPQFLIEQVMMFLNSEGQAHDELNPKDSKP